MFVGILQGSKSLSEARIVLLAVLGKNNREIANELEVSLDNARLWRQRWLDLQPISLDDLSIEERLDDLPRPGVSPRLTLASSAANRQLTFEFLLSQYSCYAAAFFNSINIIDSPIRALAYEDV